MSHSSSDHEHLTSYDVICYEGNDNNGSMEDLNREIEHLRMETKEYKGLISTFNREAAEMEQMCETIIKDN